MEIKVNNGTLKQWDTGRTVQIIPDEGDKLQQVAFSCPHMASPVIVTPDADGKADIPDGLLRHAGMLTVNAMLTTSDRKRMTRSKDFPVEVAVLPEDYNSGAGTGTGGSASEYKQPEWGVEENGVILPEATYEVNPDMGAAVIITPLNKPIAAGEVCTVNYGGVDYACTAVASADAGGYVLGNGSMMEIETPNADSPFMLVVSFEEAAQAEGIYAMFFPFDGAESCTFSIKGELTHKIPAEYVDGSGLYIVNVDISAQYTADKTFDQVYKAIADGKAVYAYVGSYYMPVANWNDSQIVFVGMHNLSSNVQYNSFTLHSNGGNEYKAGTISLN